MNLIYTKHAKPIIFIPNGENDKKEKVRLPIQIPTRPRSPVRARKNIIKYDDSDDDSYHAPGGSPRADHDDMAELDCEKTEWFWKTIASFQWLHATDGLPNIQAVHNIISKMSQDQKKHFKLMYLSAYDVMHARLIEDGMFERNGIEQLDDQAKVISHAIAMGLEQYNVLMDDPYIYQFFIEQDECQSLNIILPIDMRH